MEGKRLLHSISLKNLLSYGSEGVTLELEPLNVLIGPNASGKSNLIAALSILAAIPRNISSAFREGGTAEDWLWKGTGDAKRAEIAVAVQYASETEEASPLGYGLTFSAVDFRPRIVAETLVHSRTTLLQTYPNSERSSPGEGTLATIRRAPGDAELWKLDSSSSVLSQLRDPINQPQMTYVSDQFGKIALFRGWPFGRGNLLKRPQEANLPDDFLLEDGSNLGLILNDLQNRRETKRLLIERLRLLYEGVEDVTTKVQGGTIQIFFHEVGLSKPVPASHLSDGTLHYLCLLTILLHPEPPPLICIEEPELGLHPDILPKIADLLLDAAKRTQLIVTTHSETLVSRLSEVPESVVVCERDDRGTHLRRLEPDKLQVWLDKYMLGELWRMGEIGGNRW